MQAHQLPVAPYGQVASHLVVAPIQDVFDLLVALFQLVEMYGGRFPKAVSVFEAGIGDALTYLRYPGSPHTQDTHDEHAGAAL
jgi:hypothetical protein